MLNNKSINHSLPLIGKNDKSCTFNRKHVENEYINLLDDIQVDILCFVKFDNDSLINVLK